MIRFRIAHLPRAFISLINKKLGLKNWGWFGVLDLHPLHHARKVTIFSRDKPNKTRQIS